jgi:dephospho-CoA kinase
MLKVGITGGIGSGKSTVCSIFEVLGIPVFYADEAARTMMDEDHALKASIATLFGEHIYVDGKLDRPLVSRAVFGNPEKLAALNALVHPASVVASDEWFALQTAPYAIKEAAIFFESGTHIGLDVMIGVRAPKELRIQRVMSRNNMSWDAVLARMDKQMDEDEKMARCDYIIVNDGEQALLPQVLHIDALLRK